MITRRNGFNQVLRTINKAQELGLQVKVNCVLMKNVNDDEIVQFAELAHSQNLNVRFIEFMPFGGNRFESAKMMSGNEVLKVLYENQIDICKVKTSIHDTTKLYQI